MNFNKIAQICLALFSMMVCVVFSFPVDKDEHQYEEIRNKRDHHHGGHGVTGPVHTFVKTDKNANFKWGVRHHVGHHYAGRR